MQDLIVSVQRLTPSTVEFDLVGVDASIANALRRVMIAEVSRVLPCVSRNR
jgi:DNA-directed RNA polymerase I and III subunit RPAC1